MKLIVQIPCFNEAETLSRTLSEVPRRIAGVDVVEILVIDDGSTDDTVEVALANGADHLVRHVGNRGLAAAFQTGMDAALALGADVVVNTDADGQYRGADIPRLVAPILDGRADMVIGDRGVGTVQHFSRQKRLLQVLGNHIVRRFSGLQVNDAVSGFRAFSREAAMRLHIVSDFSHTIETIIQAAKKNLLIVSIDVESCPNTRESRLFGSTTQFLYLSAKTLVRIYAMYSPLRTFIYLALALVLTGTYPIARFLAFYFYGDGGGHIQSLVIGSMFVILGFISMLMGLLGDLANMNRKLLETTLERVKRAEYDAIARNIVSVSSPKRIE